MTASGAGRGERRSGRHDEHAVAARGRTRDEDDYDEYENGDYDDYDQGGDYDDGRREGDEERAPARRRGRAGGLSATDAAQAALRHITGMTAKPAEGVTSVRPVDDGWAVGVEVLDARHIPRSSDTLALYEVEIDPDGELRSYHRVARYSRARGSSEAS